jgi:hypothetical protein
MAQYREMIHGISILLKEKFAATRGHPASICKEPILYARLGSTTMKILYLALNFVFFVHVT